VLRLRTECGVLLGPGRLRDHGSLMFFVGGPAAYAITAHCCLLLEGPAAYAITAHWGLGGLVVVELQVVFVVNFVVLILLGGRDSLG
jgi:hypothetical protein